MKIIVAPDKFKGSCSAVDAAGAIARGWQSVFPADEAVLIPVADGGEGTLEAFCAACGGQYRAVAARDPLGTSREARWLHMDDGTAVIEMAQTSGLALVPADRRNIRLADTYGTGQAIRAALDEGCRTFIVGIGGSATNDGGMGMLRALGARFLAGAEELTHPGELSRLENIDFAGFDGRVGLSRIVVACDVANPLCGPNGATAVFGPQKGGTGEDLAHMDRCLERLARIAAAQLGFDRSGSPGAGAAGGLGWALMQCCGAEMKPGIDVVMQAARFEETLDGAGLVLTGEGSLDGQTAMGKVPVGIAAKAAPRGVPVAVVAGRLGPGHEAVYSLGIDCAIGLATGPMCLEDMMEHAVELIEQAAARLARMIQTGRRLERNR